MFKFENYKLSQIFTIITLVFFSGFVIYGFWSFKTLAELKVHGPIYQKVIKNKDLVADILPPPSYILESYLTILQLSSETEKNNQDLLIEKLSLLESEYFTRYNFWKKEVLPQDLENYFLVNSYEPAVIFYHIAASQLIPAIRKKDQLAIKSAMAELKSLYEIHRKAINDVVSIANNHTSSVEAFAKTRMINDAILMLVILIISLLAGLAIAEIGKRSIFKQLGSEPSILSVASQNIAQGNLDIELEINENDHTSVMSNIEQMRLQLKELIGRKILEERLETHKSTLFASYHYLNNTLNNFQIILLQIEDDKGIDKELLASIKDSLAKTASEMRDFGQLENPTRDNIEKFVKDRL